MRHAASCPLPSINELLDDHTRAEVSHVAKDWPRRAIEACLQDPDAPPTLGCCIAATLQDLQAHLGCAAPSHSFEVLRAALDRPALPGRPCHRSVHVRVSTSVYDLKTPGLPALVTVEEDATGKACLCLAFLGEQPEAATARPRASQILVTRPLWQLEAVCISARQVAVMPLLGATVGRSFIDSADEHMLIFTLEEDRAMDELLALLVAGGLSPDPVAHRRPPLAAPNAQPRVDFPELVLGGRCKHTPETCSTAEHRKGPAWNGARSV